MILTNLLHEQFAQHVAQSGNAAEAARSIGYDRNARQRGSQLLRRPDVQARVEELLRDRPSLSVRLAHSIDAETIHRAAQAITFLASLA